MLDPTNLLWSYRWLRFPATIVLSGVYGWIHWTAFRWVFATRTEFKFWIGASLVTTALPLATFMLFDVTLRYKGSGTTFSSRVDSLMLLLLIGLYTLARGYLIVEPLYGLRLMPAGVYQKVQWSSFIPHLH